MKVCFPVMSNNGLESPVFGHFGSAPMFMVVNTETLELTEISNVASLVDDAEFPDSLSESFDDIVDMIVEAKH